MHVKRQCQRAVCSHASSHCTAAWQGPYQGNWALEQPMQNGTSSSLCSGSHGLQAHHGFMPTRQSKGGLTAQRGRHGGRTQAQSVLPPSS